MATKKRSANKPRAAKDTGAAVSPQEQNDRNMIALLESIDRKLPRGDGDHITASPSYPRNEDACLSAPQQSPAALEELVLELRARTNRMRSDISGLASRIMHGAPLGNNAAAGSSVTPEKASYGPGKDAALDALHNLNVIDEDISAIARYVINS
jgi:hypothetical protein